MKTILHYMQKIYPDGTCQFCNSYDELFDPQGIAFKRNKLFDYFCINCGRFYWSCSDDFYIHNGGAIFNLIYKPFQTKALAQLLCINCYEVIDISEENWPELVTKQYQGEGSAQLAECLCAKCLHNTIATGDRKFKVYCTTVNDAKVFNVFDSFGYKQYTIVEPPIVPDKVVVDFSLKDGLQ